MPQSRLTRRVFEWDYNIASRGGRSWNQDVKSILEQCNAGDIFDRDQWQRHSIDSVARQVRQELNIQFRQQLSADAAPMSRLRVYNQIEDFSQVELPLYIKISDRYKRSLVAKLRSGTLPIAIETGRYVNKPAPERICRNCENNLVENEEHFIFQCPKYDELRRKYLPTNADSNIDGFKYIYLDFNRTKNLAQYIHEAMQRHK